jgi:hypothetical protein
MIEYSDGVQRVQSFLVGKICRHNLGKATAESRARWPRGDDRLCIDGSNRIEGSRENPKLIAISCAIKPTIRADNSGDSSSTVLEKEVNALQCWKLTVQQY